MRILALNPGSSSLKATIVEQPGDKTLARLEQPLISMLSAIA
jgi:acetate kinase